MKEWTCKCGSKVFVLTRLESLTVDFSKEGAIEGHPKINRSNVRAWGIHCSNCGIKIPDIMADEMLKEII